MAKLSPPPLNDPIMNDEGTINPSWALFFDQLYRGDRGVDWLPQFVGLTTVGAPTITGRYYRLSERIAYFSIHIVPGTSTTSTAGTTYISNFPLRFIQNGACNAVSGLLGSSAGMIDANTNRIYPPGWNAVTVPLTIVGIAEVR